ncbi:concanavalin A-like lectin/glucanase domain-containing protein [Lasiosphaeria miniovina]|uniref:Concanavalin A-like lectin/glucanase domain-containing protein n=1 Tax=Lasiosphaeria miniovina TaxID=1954250 RepID=A0AA39ZSW2_9PEZI|nr:concanavalin A-like lectin/glucanase domain-containing protein [Lasiosphaeria miniovina]KAK0703018.1 concanavalin A-like lectin/glucanase domain-containing protein [Lasiosphaeria miniovina]
MSLSYRPANDLLPPGLLWWENVCSSAGSFVTPGFESLFTPKVDDKTGDEPSRNWSGAVISATKNYSFDRVWGSWTVSRPHPDNWAWKPQYWKSAEFAAGTWVGIDGEYENGKGSRDVLQAGVGHRCIVSTHQDTEYKIHPWWEWAPERPWTITGFQIAEGDLVSVSVFAETSTTAHILFNNLSACTYTSFNVTAPGTTELKGNCAEWIVEAHHPLSRGKPSMSYLGATFFFNCGAIEKAVADTHGEIKQGDVLSTAVRAYSNDVVLGVVAERRVHSHRIVYTPPGSLWARIRILGQQVRPLGFVAFAPID